LARPDPERTAERTAERTGTELLSEGTANYFATNFSTCVKLYQKLDKWIRMRVRCMKFKRKLSYDNYRLRQGSFDKKLGLLKLLGFTQTTMSTT
jgi:RNA-directed DNA polymerase